MFFDSLKGSGIAPDPFCMLSIRRRISPARPVGLLLHFLNQFQHALGTVGRRRGLDGSELLMTEGRVEHFSEGAAIADDLLVVELPPVKPDTPVPVIELFLK